MAESNAIIDHRDTGERAPLVMNRAQRFMIGVMLAQADAGKPIRLIIPKARKMGVSTLVQTLFVFLSEFIPNYRALTVAHNAEETRGIFKIAKTIHDNTNLGDGDSSRNEIRYGHGSSYRCRTAKGAGVARGDTFYGLHISELASCQTVAGLDKAALAAMLNSVALKPHTIVVIESTGLGPSGEFYRRCCRAKDGLGEYALCFFPWFWDEGYESPAPDNFVLSEYEATLQRNTDISLDQLWWRRRKMVSDGGAEEGSLAEVDFKREFPSTFEECFEAAQGRVYTTFSEGKHKKVHRVGEDWDLYRAIDWGWTVDPFVCLWVAHNKSAPPGLAVHPSCKNTLREMVAYEMDPKNDQPSDKNNHCPDAIRYLVVSTKLRGFVYVYREFYMRQATNIGISGLARKIHDMSGWELPPGENIADLGKYEAGSSGEEFEITICDRSQPEAINQLTRWGIPSTGNSKPILNPKKVSEIKDGIFEVDTLVRGEVLFDSPWVDPQQGLVAEAVRKTYHGQMGGRQISLTDREREAWQEEIHKHDESEEDPMAASFHM